MSNCVTLSDEILFHYGLDLCNECELEEELQFYSDFRIDKFNKSEEIKFCFGLQLCNEFDSEEDIQFIFGLRM